jgi:hypothetical protein
LTNHATTGARQYSRLQELLARFSGRRGAWTAAALAMLLSAPSLSVGWLLDDYYHRSLMPGVSTYRGIGPVLMDLFRFFDGDPAHTRALIDAGTLPWWTYPGIKGAFWRPFSALTHWLDYRLWPTCAPLMHAQSLLWLAALVLAVGALYRRSLTPFGAALATLLYAADDARAVPAAWLSNRNALLGTLFGVLALLAHDRWRRSGWRAGSVLGPACLALALFSGELGVATGGYLLAYALFLDYGPWLRRAATLIPYVLVGLGWRLLWNVLGFGVANMGFYVDPLGEPSLFLTTLVERVPLLFLGQWALPSPELAVFLSDEWARYMWLAGIGLLMVIGLSVLPLLLRDRMARFYGLGMLLAIIPACTTGPADRLLPFVGVGAMGLLAQLTGRVAEADSPAPPGRLARPFLTLIVGVLLVVHLVFAPVALAVRSAIPLGTRHFLDSLAIRTPFDESVTNQDLIVVNAPAVVETGYLPIIRRITGEPVPRRVRALAAGLPALQISRPDARTLLVRPEEGFLKWKFDYLFRDARFPFHVGEHITLTGLDIEITEMLPDGRAAEARFEFGVPLEDASLRWLQWDRGEFVPYVPPPIGATIDLRPTLAQ